MDQKTHAMAVVQRTLDTLGEHFDSVQIFVTLRSDAGDGTVRVSKGCGDYFARYGHVAYWLEIENQAARNNAKIEE